MWAVDYLMAIPNGTDTAAVWARLYVFIAHAGSCFQYIYCVSQLQISINLVHKQVVMMKIPSTICASTKQHRLRGTTPIGELSIMSKEIGV